MATLELIETWERTERYLMTARGLLRADVESAYRDDLAEFADFLNHNELGLAFDYLTSIVREAQWDSIPILDALSLAAQNMKLAEDESELLTRIGALRGMEIGN
jgi:hypothetical protein